MSISRHEKLSTVLALLERKRFHAEEEEMKNER